MASTPWMAAAVSAALTISACSPSESMAPQDRGAGDGKANTASLPWVRGDAATAAYGDSMVETPTVHARRTQALGIADGECKREEIGALLGGLIGGMLGRRIGGDDNSTAGTVAGVVIGVLIGRQIGKSMDDEDEACTGQVLERAYDGQTVRWTNPDSGVRYAVTPERTFLKGDRFCRDYVTMAVVDERSKSKQTVACRNADGSWEAVGRPD